MAKLKKVKTVIIFAVLASILLAGVCAAGVKFPLVPDGTQNDAGDERDVRALVEAFGKKLQNVSLLAPADVLKKALWKTTAGLSRLLCCEMTEIRARPANKCPSCPTALNAESKSGTFQGAGEVRG